MATVCIFLLTMIVINVNTICMTTIDDHNCYLNILFVTTIFIITFSVITLIITIVIVIIFCYKLLFFFFHDFVSGH